MNTFWMWTWAFLAISQAMLVGFDLGHGDDKEAATSLLKLAACVLFVVSYWLERK